MDFVRSSSIQQAKGVVKININLQYLHSQTLSYPSPLRRMPPEWDLEQSCTCPSNRVMMELATTAADRTLQKHERNYGINKLEALAVVWATKHFHVYLAILQVKNNRQ